MEKGDAGFGGHEGGIGGGITGGNKEEYEGRFGGGATAENKEKEEEKEDADHGGIIYILWFHLN